MMRDTLYIKKKINQRVITTRGMKIKFAEAPYSILREWSFVTKYLYLGLKTA